jgi:hypothetical protein
MHYELRGPSLRTVLGTVPLHDHATAATHRERADGVLAARLFVHLANAIGGTSDGGTATVDDLRNAASGKRSARAAAPDQETLDFRLE